MFSTPSNDIYKQRGIFKQYIVHFQKSIPNKNNQFHAASRIQQGGELREFSVKTVCSSEKFFEFLRVGWLSSKPSFYLGARAKK